MEDFFSLQFSTISKFATMSPCDFIVVTNINSLNQVVIEIITS